MVSGSQRVVSGNGVSYAADLLNAVADRRPPIASPTRHKSLLLLFHITYDVLQIVAYVDTVCRETLGRVLGGHDRDRDIMKLEILSGALPVLTAAVQPSADVYCSLCVPARISIA